MVNVEVIKPCCIKYDFPRHKSFQSRFMHEWKSDEIIFDLVSVNFYKKVESKVSMKTLGYLQSLL